MSADRTRKADSSAGRIARHQRLIVLGVAILLVSWGARHFLYSLALHGNSRTAEPLIVAHEIDAEVERRGASTRRQLEELRAPVYGGRFRLPDIPYEVRDRDGDRIGRLYERLERIREDVRGEFLADVFESEADAVSGMALTLRTAGWFLEPGIVLRWASIFAVLLVAISGFALLTAPGAPGRWQVVAGILLCLVILQALLTGGPGAL